MHLEQEILAGLKALIPDLDALTTCNTGSMRCSAPHGRCRVALQLQAANRVDGYLAVCLARYTGIGSRVVTDLQMEIEIELNAGTARALWWRAANQATTVSAADAGASAQAALNHALADWVTQLNAAGVRLTPVAGETTQ